MKDTCLLAGCLLLSFTSLAQGSSKRALASSSSTVALSVKVDTGSFNLHRGNSAIAPSNITGPLQQRASYQLFPDPATTDITLKINAASATIVSLQIYNSEGSLIKRLDNISINSTFSYVFHIADYPAGTYFLKVVSPDGTIYKNIGFVKM